MTRFTFGYFLLWRFRLTCFNACSGSVAFTVIAACNALLRFFMTRFTRQFLAFQACLTRLKARLGFCCTFRLKIDSAQLSFFLPVILNQRNIAWTDIGAGAAFDTVIDIMRTRFFMIAALAIPVKLLRQQLRLRGYRIALPAVQPFRWRQAPEYSW